MTCSFAGHRTGVRSLAWALALAAPLLAWAGGPPQGWTTRSAPTTQDLEGVAFGDGVFVAVGANGTILTSPDGVAWTPRSAGTTQRLRGVGWGRSSHVFAAVGQGGTVLFSDDHGASWTANNVSASQILVAVTAGTATNGGERFVAIGNTGSVFTANHPALPWSAGSLPLPAGTSATLMAVAGNGLASNSAPQFVITGSKGLVATSPDALGWTVRPCGTGSSVTAVGWQSGQNYAAFAEVYGAKGLVSSQLQIAGTSCSASAAAANAPVAGITYGDGYGVAVGYASIRTTPQNSIGSWTLTSAPGNADLRAVAYGNGSFVAVGAHGAIVQSTASGQNGGMGGAWVGCYVDDASRALPVQLMAGGATPASCIAAAKARGFAYAGVQYGGACHAGNVPGFAKVGDDACKQPCAAASGEYCGSAWHNGIHATGLTPPPAPVATEQGCYSDKPDRALPVALQASGATRESCLAAARSRGLLYAGLQYKGQCFGGNTLRYTRETDARRWCNTPCSANPGQTCGGEWHNTVLGTGLVLAPVPAAGSYQGCFKDDPVRTLPVMLMPSGATPGSCVAAARAAGLAWAGVQFEGQCFGGDQRPTNPAPAGDCQQTKCTADRGQDCGGAWRNAVYSTK